MAEQIYKSSDATVWIDEKIQSKLEKLEAKITGEFEDLKFTGSRTTHSDYLGFTIEGTITRKKTSSDLWQKILMGFKTGEFEQMKIIAATKVGSKTERVAITGVTVNEAMLINIENQNSITEEIPFKATDFEILGIV